MIFAPKLALSLLNRKIDFSVCGSESVRYGKGMLEDFFDSIRGIVGGRPSNKDGVV